MAIIDKDENALWLAFNRVEGLGAVGRKKILEAFPSIQQVFSANAIALERCGLKQAVIEAILAPDWGAVEADLNWLDHPDRHLVVMGGGDYPPLLRHIPDPPVVLFVYGDPEVLRMTQIGIVGSRNPDAGGQRMGREFAEGLAKAGAVVTSGLALGIDGVGHNGALAAGGSTVAVTGNGLDMIYPARHKSLAEKILERGALVSEFPPGVKPLPQNFPRRNRIISGMSAGVLVIQATLESGSLITARYAIEQGREVFAIPGSILNPLSRGCHALIKEGAKLTESVNDVIEELDFLIQTTADEETRTDAPAAMEELDDDYKLLIDNMAYDPISVDELIELTGLTIDAVSSMLLTLELRGLVEAQAGGVYVRV